MRKIIHIDADCFFAALEMRDNPALTHLPIAVGGSARRRGVISTCNYVARRYGIHSAMATAYALRLCPNLQLLPHRFDVYKEASQAMRAIFSDYSALVEPLSLDEAYIDVTDSSTCAGSATLIAEEIRARVACEVGITVSAGVANNKFLAKVASDWQKPNGLTVITPDQNDAFSRALPVKKLNGVGKVTAQKLEQMGLNTCADLRDAGQSLLVERFGRFGALLYERAFGIDERSVQPTRVRKSISVEHTYDQDFNAEGCASYISPLLESLKMRIAKQNAASLVNKLFVKVKFADFTVTTMERKASSLTSEAFGLLLMQAVTRSAQQIRLLGLGVRLEHNHKEQGHAEQLSLFN